LAKDNTDELARNGRDTAPGLQRSHVSHDEQVPQMFCLGIVDIGEAAHQTTGATKKQESFSEKPSIAMPDELG
jgi:hypothetical protein